MSQKGGSQVTVLLDFVTEQEVSEFAEALADFVVDRGMANASDDELKAMIVVRGYTWPPEPDDLVTEFSDASMVIIPNPDRGNEN